MGLTEPARGESCPSGLRRGPATPGEDKVHPRIRNPSVSLKLRQPGHGRKRRSHGARPPRTVWKPQPHQLIADWLELMEPARGESCPSGQRRGSAAPGEDKVPSLDRKFSHISTTPTNRGRKRRSPVSIPPRAVWKPQSHLIGDWLGLMEPARGESCPSGQR